MAERILFAGGRLDSAFPTNGTVSEITNSSWFNTTYADAALRPDAQSYSFETRLYDSAGNRISLGSGTTFWHHVDIMCDQTVIGININLVEFRDSAGYPWLGLRSVGNGVYAIAYNSGTGASPVWTTPQSTAFTLGHLEHDFKIVIGADGNHTFTIYRGRSLLMGPISFTNAGFTNVNSVRYTSANASNWGYSQILSTELIPTVAALVRTCRASGAGSNAGWTGAYTNVNEPSNSDSTYDTTDTAGVYQTYAMGDVTTPTGYSIRSVWHWVRARSSGSSPANMKSILRLSGSNIASANLTNLDVGFAPVFARYELNPATGTAWTDAAWNGAEAGYLSAA